jgi:erythromycin esterase-like protein
MALQRAASFATVARSRERVAGDIANLVARHAEPLPRPTDELTFGAFFDRFADARVVLLGESTHGTSEYYRSRAAISRRLIEEHGFDLIAVEADWPDAARVDAYVRGRAPRTRGTPPFARFPQWMWRNAEFAGFTEWLRLHNHTLPAERRVSFRGLDLYSLNSSIEAVLQYLERRDPVRAVQARRRYGCLTPWTDEPARYGAAMLGSADDCEDEVVRQLHELLAHRLEYLRDDGDEFLDAAQNARVVRAAERYYRAMYRSSTESWNLRDRHMFDTLQNLLKSKPDAKAVIWAHNSHIGNAAATAMGWAGEFNIGELCRKSYGDQAVLIGFGTDRGTVAAASDWDSPMETKAVRPARPDSYEHAWRQARIPRSLTDWRGRSRRELVEALSEALLGRAIGVVYRPETELQSHYFECLLADQFDAYVWFEESTAVEPLPAAPAPADALPDTYPFGV